METNNVTRTINVFHPSRQGQTVTFQSTANTYGELKRDITRNGLSLDNMRVIEGRTQLQFITDDSVLPRNIQTRTGVTNDLVIVVTYDKIKNGGLSFSEAVSKIEKFKKDVQDGEKIIIAFFGMDYYNMPSELFLRKANEFFGNNEEEEEYYDNDDEYAMYEAAQQENVEDLLRQAVNTVDGVNTVSHESVRGAIALIEQALNILKTQA